MAKEEADEQEEFDFLDLECIISHKTLKFSKSSEKVPNVDNKKEFFTVTQIAGVLCPYVAGKNCTNEDRKQHALCGYIGQRIDGVGTHVDCDFAKSMVIAMSSDILQDHWWSKAERRKIVSVLCPYMGQYMTCEQTKRTCGYIGQPV